jgi:O-antigen/teichoic acid export membrane protein
MERGRTSNIMFPIILSTLHKFSSTVFGFLNFFILARLLTKFDLGIWSIFLFVIAAFELSKGSLIKNAHIRLIINTEKDKYNLITGSSILVNIGFTLIFVITILLLGPFFSKWLNLGNRLFELLYSYVPGLCIMIFFSHYEAVQQSHHNFKNGFTANMIRQGSFFMFLLFHFLTASNIDLIDLVKYYSIGNATGFLVLFYLTRKKLIFSFHYSIETIKEIFSYGSYMLGGNIITQISSNIDQILLSRVLSANYIGYYGIASRVMYAVDIPMNGASEAMFPSFTKASSEKDKSEFNDYLEKIIGSLFALMLPICIFLIYTSEYIIKIIAGSDYVDGASILEIYVLISFINIFRHQSSNTLLSLGKSKMHFIITSIHFTATVVLMYVGISNFNYLGPAYARLLLALVSLAVWILIMKRLTNINISNILNYFLGFYPSLIKRVFNKG